MGCEQEREISRDKTTVSWVYHEERCIMLAFQHMGWVSFHDN